jgi:hypothetical protein
MCTIENSGTALGDAGSIEAFDVDEDAPFDVTFSTDTGLVYLGLHTYRGRLPRYNTRLSVDEARRLGEQLLNVVTEAEAPLHTSDPQPWESAVKQELYRWAEKGAVGTIDDVVDAVLVRDSAYPRYLVRRYLFYLLVTL